MSRSKETRNNQPPDEESKSFAKKFKEWLAQIKSATTKLNLATRVADKIRRQIPHQSSEQELNKRTDRVFETIRNVLGYLLNRLDLEVQGDTDFEKYKRPIIFVVAPHNGMPDAYLVRQAMSKETRKNLLFVSARDHFEKILYLIPSSLICRIFLLNREGGDKSAIDLMKLSALMALGQNLVIFPEGTRNTKPHTPMRNRNLKTGFARIANYAKDLNPLIIPIYLSNTADLMPKGSWLPKFRKNGIKQKVKVIIGEPLEINSLFPLEKGKDNTVNPLNAKHFKIFAEILKEVFVLEEEGYNAHPSEHEVGDY